MESPQAVCKSGIEFLSLIEALDLKAAAERNAVSGLFDEAIGLTQRISDVAIKSLSYAKIAEIMTYPHLQNLPRARVVVALAHGIAQSLADEELRDLLLSRTARVMADAQDFSNACAGAEEIQVVFIRSLCLISIANRLVDIHNFSEARVVARKVHDIAGQENCVENRAILLKEVDKLIGRM